MTKYEMLAGDNYQVYLSEPLTEMDRKNLTALYLPMIGMESFCVYCFLAGEAENEKTRVERILVILNMNIYDLDRCIVTLETFGLLKRYYNALENNCKFFLNAPLSASRFLSDAFFGRKYMETVGEEQFRLYVARNTRDHPLNDNDIEVETSVDLRKLKNWAQGDEAVYQDIRKSLAATDTAAFDTQSLLAGMSDFMFPAVLRTVDNMDTIASMALTYHVDEENMRRLLLKSIDARKKEIDWQGLKNRCLEYAENATADQPASYTDDPITFLSRLQNNLPVVASEKKLIDYLRDTLKLSDEVINAVIEYTLANNNKRLSRRYVEKLAVTLARKGIENYALAKEELNSVRTGDRSSQGKYQFTASEVEELSTDEISNLRTLMFKEGNDEKNGN